MDIIIEELDGSLWVAAMDRGRLLGLEVDPLTERVRFGSIYWAKVRRIDAGLDAAFLDLDGEHTGILYNRDVRIKAKTKITRGGDTPVGKVLTPGMFVLVQAKTGYLPSDDLEDVAPLDKTPVMTMDIVLHGRYLIGTPFEKQSRVSQRIRHKKLRGQLEKMIGTLKDVTHCILRKAAAHTQTDIITRESRILKTVWENVERAAEGDKPHLLMMGPDAVQRTLADQSGARIDRIDLIADDQLDTAAQWCEIFAPDLAAKINPVEIEDDADDLGLFIQRDVMDSVDKLLQPYVVLPGGGNIIIQPTAALTAIDVNSGADRRGAAAVNLEAAMEVARQIKLRNLGGIIVIDLLKMTNAAQRNKVLDTLQGQFDDDPCTVQIHGLTKLGLLELTRARRTATLAERVHALGIDS